ncbi:MAG: metallophosphoesterase [Casimicrobiaceae bacterium]
MTSVHSITIPDDVESIALCGGPYSNFAAVDAFLAATAATPWRFCLGDIGGMGPWPDRTLDTIRGSGMQCVQGNYDYAVGHDARDCGCGYVDAEDRRTAQVSFDYTAAHTSEHHKTWLRTLPTEITLHWRGRSVLLCHGSPDAVNEFVWESETDDATIDAWLAARGVCGIAATHSGIPWVRHTAHGFWCNVGVLGRPPHHGSPDVGYAIMTYPPGADLPRPRLRRLAYAPVAVAAGIRSEGLPDAFAVALEQGTWTTCSAILPPLERMTASRYPDGARARHSLFAAPQEAHARHAATAQDD